MPGRKVAVGAPCFAGLFISQLRSTEVCGAARPCSTPRRGRPPCVLRSCASGLASPMSVARTGQVNIMFSYLCMEMRKPPTVPPVCLSPCSQYFMILPHADPAYPSPLLVAAQIKLYHKDDSTAQSRLLPAFGQPGAMRCFMAPAFPSQRLAF